jgi:hypothetical protein
MLATSTSCRRVIDFKNCTNDTLFVGASHCDNIDSIDCQLEPRYHHITENSILDSTDVSLWEIKVVKTGDYYVDFIPCKYGYIYPDSIGSIDDCYLYDKGKPDTTYFFLIKWSDAKRYSWDEIRKKKLYRRWIVAKDKKGEYDRNIRYPESADY